MALLHKAVLTPSKLELLQGWVPAQPWGGGGALEQVGAFRFDDPAGEVGIETLLVRAGDGPVLHVPLTYRSAPLEGAGAGLIGTMEHSLLGERWVYDGAADPVYASVLATVVLNGGSHAEQHWVIDGETVEKPLDTFAEGTGGAAELGATAPVPVEPVVLDAVTVESGPESSLVRGRARSGGELLIEVVRRVAGEGSVSAEDAASAARAEAATAVSGESALLVGRWPGEPAPRLLASATRA
ncbi:hypothetical protein C5B96_07755 [Subtercola sp. Z020]|uniref:CG0192-related protein n=1 Tax=Subtercola sp. Z020 TaxID=2080582 RepID=UPI000CE7E298|nr:hypothetical protein [Subtercola sp. Z020]PPF84116.1 hypothetical protein C5B96_07755 [Subtercola sp. Z020]